MATQQDKAVIDLVINGKQSETSLYNIKTAAVNAQKALSRMAETDPGYAKQKKELESLLRAQQERIVRINQEKTAWQRFTADMPSLTAGVTAGNLLSQGISAVASVIPAAINNYRQFNAASQDLSAVTGAVGKDLEYLNETASKTGPEVGKSADQMLDAYKLMASAKPELLDNIQLLTKTTEAAITLSQAGKIDLAQATTVTAESLNQFGESADQANRYINVIAAGANAGSAEIDEMGAALKNSGTVAKAQGVTFEQTNAILQSMSSIALKGGEAGTNLRNVLLTLGSGSDDTNPRIVGLDQALANLAAKNLSTAEMTKLFGKENLVAAQHIINHRAEITQLTKQVTGTQEAFRMAETNNASFDHQLEQFSATVNQISVSIGTQLIPTLTSWLKTGSSLLKQLPDIISWLSRNGEWILITGVPALIAYNGALIKATAAAAAQTVAEGYRRLAFQAGYTWLLITEGATKAYAFATSVLTGQITLQTAVVTIARTAWATLSAVMLANPIGIVVAAFGGLIAAIKYFSEHTERALDIERKKNALQQQAKKNTEANAKVLQDLNQKVSHANELSKIEQDNLKKTIVLKQSEARARLANALARAREIAREAADPSFWQGVKQGAKDFVTGNWGNLSGEGLAKRRAEIAEQNKAQAYAEAKAAANVDQLEADIAQFDSMNAQMTTKPSTASTGGGGGGQTEEQKKAAAKKKQQAEHDAKELADMLAESRKSIMAGEQSDYDRQVADFAAKYTKMYDLAKNNQEQVNEVQRLSLIEWANIEKAYNEKKLKDDYEINTAHLKQTKDFAENEVELQVFNGIKTKQEGDAEKLRLEEQYVDASELLIRAYYKTQEELSKDNTDKLAKLESEKQAALLKIQQDRLKNNTQQRALKRDPLDRAFSDDSKDLQAKYEQDQKALKERARKGQMTQVEIRNAEISLEKAYLQEKRKLYQSYYDILLKMGVLSAEEQKEIERKKGEDLLEIDSKLIDAQQSNYEGKLGAIARFLDEKQQYMNDAVTIMSALFAADQDKLNVEPLLAELDQLQQKTKLTSSEQERMKDIVAQIGKVMPDAVTGTDAYGAAISVNTEQARKEVDAQKARANVMHKVALAEKAWAMAQIGIAFGRALMQAVVDGSGTPFPGNLLAIGLGIGKATLTHGAALAQVMSKNISAPAFADGGFTNSSAAPSGFTSGPTYYNKGNYIAGEAGREWIMSAPMLRNPVFANLAGAMQALQETGQYRSVGSLNGSSGGSQASGMSDMLLAQINQQLQINNSRLEDMASRPINNNWFDVERTKDRIAEIHLETSL